MRWGRGGAPIHGSKPPPWAPLALTRKTYGKRFCVRHSWNNPIVTADACGGPREGVRPAYIICISRVEPRPFFITSKSYKRDHVCVWNTCTIMRYEIFDEIYARGRKGRAHRHMGAGTVSTVSLRRRGAGPVELSGARQ